MKYINWVVYVNKNSVYAACKTYFTPNQAYFIIWKSKKKRFAVWTMTLRIYLKMKIKIYQKLVHEKIRLYAIVYLCRADVKDTLLTFYIILKQFSGSE